MLRTKEFTFVNNCSQHESNAVFGVFLQRLIMINYARCMALEDTDARWQAQMWFHEAQSARSGGGTMSHKLGHRLNAFLNKHEGKVLTPSDLHALTITR